MVITLRFQSSSTNIENVNISYFNKKVENKYLIIRIRKWKTNYLIDRQLHRQYNEPKQNCIWSVQSNIFVQKEIPRNKFQNIEGKFQSQLLFTEYLLGSRLVVDSYRIRVNYCHINYVSPYQNVKVEFFMARYFCDIICFLKMYENFFLQYLHSSYATVLQS